MIHIVSAKNKKYMVVNIARNGEVLSTSEILSSKQKCYQNARALLRDCFGSLADHLWPGVLIQDDTMKPNPVVYFLTLEKKEKYPSQRPEKKYKPKK